TATGRSNDLRPATNGRSVYFLENAMKHPLSPLRLEDSSSSHDRGRRRNGEGPLRRSPIYCKGQAFRAVFAAKRSKNR
ncbi:MAG: hypothetical protein ABGX16_01670, partial [Pirellulales bacterium]